ncbi:hypothetical protein Tco_0440102 [Tanacetum coccineum]
MYVPRIRQLPNCKTIEALQGDGVMVTRCCNGSSNLDSTFYSNELYQSMDACTTANEEMGNMFLSTTAFCSVNGMNLETNNKNGFFPIDTHDDVQTNSEDPLASAMLLFARGITQNFSNPTNNRLCTSSNTRNQANIPGALVVNISKQELWTLRTSSSGNTSTVQCYNVVEKDIMLGILEEIEELSENICLMARIQPANNTSDAGPSYDSAFISENKMNDPIAVANKQNCWTIDYQQIIALYKDFVPQKELSAEQKYCPLLLFLLTRLQMQLLLSRINAE